MQGVGDLQKLHGIPGIAYAKFLMRTAQWTAARDLSTENLRYCEWDRKEEDAVQCQLALAEIALQERYVSESHDWLARAERFPSQAGWQEVLVRAALLQGRNHLVRGDPVVAREELARGAGAAERFGFGILAADLLIALGEADLERDPAGAERVGREGLRRAEAYGYVWGVNPT
jgi:hypothetical protein